MISCNHSAPFCQIIDDPSGNSFVENPHAPQKDDALVITHYNRTPQQEEMLGLQVSELKKPEECLELVKTYFAAVAMCTLSQNTCASYLGHVKDLG